MAWSKSSIITALFVAFAIIAPSAMGELFAAVQGWITHHVGWFYVLAVAGFLTFTVIIAFSGMGAIKLGPDHSSPDYTYKSWFAMLFSAGMGIGLMFFGVAEPVMHYMSPPTGEAETVDAARTAMRVTMFHWGMHAWAIYAVVALSLAYFAFRHNLPLTIRSAFYPLIGDRIYGPIGHAIDTFAVLGTIFGVATSLGIGVTQVNAGLTFLFGVPESAWVQIPLIAGITALAALSVGLGLDTGIKRISELNLILAIALLGFVLIFGPTVFLLQTLVQNTGEYVSNLFRMTFNLYAREPTDWIGGWTIFYWGWWIAWSPFVGMFIARVSRGRTIREFIIGVLLVPVGFTFMWMTFFGDTALHMIIQGGVAGLGEAVSANSSVAIFEFFNHLPFSTLTSILATILVITFFVTSSDSGSLVVDMLTSGGDTNQPSPLWQRLFWAVLEGAVAAALLLAGGLVALQTATIASALPFAVIMCFMCWGLWKALRLETTKRSSLANARVMPKTPTKPIPWRDRLRTVVRQPELQEVLAFMQDVVSTSFEEVAAAWREEGLDARVARETSDDPQGRNRVWVEVRHGDDIDFFYSVRAMPYEPPSFLTEEHTNPDRANFYRAEIFLKEGGQGYDIMGWGKEAIISDLLDHYEKHLHFLNSLR
ncbi:MAG: BCCT family transporter [Planctomycetota bacterium]|nr:MAG: BCCT family transporter [Planctomycetota bacterium]